MVSIWPMVSAESSTFAETLDKDCLVRAEKNLPVFMRFADTYHDSKYLHVIDFVNPGAGDFGRDLCRENYSDRGVRVFYEEMKEAGEELPINPCRSAWAGSRKYGACV